MAPQDGGVFTMLVTMFFQMIMAGVVVLIELTLTLTTRAFFDFCIASELALKSSSCLDTDFCNCLLSLAHSLFSD